VTSRLSAAELGAAAEPLVIALACTGDAGAFAELVKRRHARVRKFMYHLCRQPALGDDLAQQVFLNAWQALPQLRTAAAFDGWLKKVMVTTWLEEVRKRRIATTTDVDLEGAATTSDATAARLDLDAALAQLPHDVRLCVVLSYNDGLSHPEIAELARLPLGTVKSHIARGAARLRELLGAYRE
jgi:RNA polymerase sigma-70 factor (ECF subfamily)